MQIKARELTALRLFVQLGAAINKGDWEKVRDLADEMAVIAMHITRKEK